MSREVERSSGPRRRSGSGPCRGLRGALYLLLACGLGLGATCCKKGASPRKSNGARAAAREQTVTVRTGPNKARALVLALRASYQARHRKLGALAPRGTEGIMLAFPRSRALGVDLRTATRPADVALVDADRQVAKVAPGQPAGSARRVDRIPALYRYALVLPAGGAARHGLASGTAVDFTLPEDARPASVLMPVTLQPPGGSAVTVAAELAMTPQETSFGLMHRRTLPPRGGMLFVFPRPQVLVFYMKNTHIPLDMIFLDDRRVVTGIVERARPLDETTVGVGRVLNRYVLEVRAGFARRHHIVRGTRAVFNLPSNPE